MATPSGSTKRLRTECNPSVKLVVIKAEEEFHVVLQVMEAAGLPLTASQTAVYLLPSFSIQAETIGGAAQKEIKKMNLTLVTPSQYVTVKSSTFL